MPKINEIPKKTYKYRLEPTKEQENIFNWTLKECWQLNKTLLKEKITAYKKKQKQPSQFDQVNFLTKIKEQNPQLKQIFSQILQNIPRQRIPAIWKNFKKRKKDNPKAGLPQSKPLYRYHSFTYPQHGFKLEKGQLVLSQGQGYPKLRVNIILHTQLKNGKKQGRPLPKKIETCSIFLKNGKWYACFVCEVEVKKPLTLEQLRVSRHLSLDMGLEKFYTTNEGYKEPIPQFYRKAEKKLTELDRKGSRKKHKRNENEKTKPSKRYLKYQAKVNKFKEKVANKRDDFVFKKARELVDNHDFFGIEELSPEKMIKRRDKYKGLPKSINDAGWIKFHNCLFHTAVEVGKKVVKVDPKNTSRQCFKCKEINVEIKLEDRKFICIDYPKCPYKEDRDINAAKNILFRAREKTFGAGTVSLVSNH